MPRFLLGPDFGPLRASSGRLVAIPFAAIAIALATVLAPIASRVHAADPAMPGLTIQTIGSGPVSGDRNRSLLLARLTLPPGGAAPAYGHDGDVIVTVESGVLGYTALLADAQATWGGADEDTAGVAFTPGTEVLLYPGDWLRVPKGALQRLRNAGPDAVVLLASAVVAAGEPFLQPFTSHTGHGPTP